MKLSPALSLFSLAAQRCAAAETDNSESLPVMEEVIVTANPIIEGSAVTRYGGNVSTVSSRQVDDLNAQDFPTN